MNKSLLNGSLRLVSLIALSSIGCAPDDAEKSVLDSGVNIAPTNGSGDSPVANPDAGVGQMLGGAVVRPPSSDAGPAAVDSGAPPATQSDAATPQGDGAIAQGDAGNNAMVGAKPKPFCMKKDSQLIVIGDSYINWISHNFPDDIAMQSGQHWRMEAVGGTSMGSGGIGRIPPQFDDSIASDPDAHTVLMDGGGNDVLVPDLTLDPFGACTNTGSSKNMSCQTIVKMAIDAADQLMNNMASKGIRDVIYFFYPHVPANTILTGDNPDEILDYALPMVKSFCDGAEQRTGGKLRCTFIDLVPLFEGHNDWYNEDIHPNGMGSAAMAKKIWEVMSDKCIGQKGPKDCCETK
jgi:hypothetical protein